MPELVISKPFVYQNVYKHDAYVKMKCKNMSYWEQIQLIVELEKIVYDVTVTKYKIATYILSAYSILSIILRIMHVIF